MKKVGGRQVDGTNCDNYRVAYLITSNTLGNGSAELGAALITSFLHTLVEASIPPVALLFVNEGVFLTTEGSKVIDLLCELEKKGAEVISCGTCLDYYGRKEQVQAGRVGDMYEISETVRRCRTVTL